MKEAYKRGIKAISILGSIVQSSLNMAILFTYYDLFFNAFLSKFYLNLL